jgi:predicted nucleic acid-binding protein
MTKRCYFDTSIFGGYFDDEFSKESRILFNQVIEGNIICLYSELTERELYPAPTHVHNLLKYLPSIFSERLVINQQVINLAEEYINQKVVGKTSREDCTHIAIATIYQADLLVSWNFKHIVNSNRIRGYNHVNSQHGLTQITIKSPREII